MSNLAGVGRRALSAKILPGELLLGARFVIGDTGRAIWVAVHGDRDGLRRVGIGAAHTALRDPVSTLGREAKRQLARYFRRPGYFFSLPLHEQGDVYTPHHRRCMEFLKSVPAGETRSYAEQAAAAGHRCARAAGQANHRNLFPIIVPCHRVIAQDGSLGGFMGSWHTGDDGALALKRALLDHESRLSAQIPTPGRAA